jgi:hypothetical protein
MIVQADSGSLIAALQGCAAVVASLGNDEFGAQFFCSECVFENRFEVGQTCKLNLFTRHRVWHFEPNLNKTVSESYLKGHNPFSRSVSVDKTLLETIKKVFEALASEDKD